MIRLPDFLVVGAAKSGTTSLWKELNSLENVFIPSIKECRFFSQMPRNFKGGAAAKFMNEGPRELGEYMALYAEADGRLSGDISNDYLYYFEKTIPFIKACYDSQCAPYPKIIIVLRRPDERVFSMYNHIIRLGSDSKAFRDAFDLSQRRVRHGYAWMFDLQGVGLSYAAVKAYVDAFENVKVLLMEDVLRDQGLSDLLEFIGVNSAGSFSLSKRANANHYGQPRSMVLNKLMNSIFPSIVPIAKAITPSFLFGIGKKIFNQVNESNLSSSKMTLSDADRMYLQDYYWDDVQRLSTLINRDLKAWL